MLPGDSLRRGEKAVAVEWGQHRGDFVYRESLTVDNFSTGNKLRVQRDLVGDADLFNYKPLPADGTAETRGSYPFGAGSTRSSAKWVRE